MRRADALPAPHASLAKQVLEQRFEQRTYSADGAAAGAQGAAAASVLELLIVVCSPHVSPLPEAGNEAVAVRTATNWGAACEERFGCTADDLRELLLTRRVRRFLLCGTAPPAPSNARRVG